MKRGNMSVDGVIETHQLFQTEDGGAVPTSTHQLELKEINHATAQSAINKWHYLAGTGFLASYRFGVFYGGYNKGVITYGIPNAANLKGVYTQDTQHEYMELTRLALAPELPKNSASRVIGVSLRLLKQREPNLKGVVTYADTEQGHEGTIYKATNFEHRGLTAPKTDFYIDGKKAGKLKGAKYSELEGEWLPRSRKHLYIWQYDS